MLEHLTGDKSYWIKKAHENLAAHRGCVASNRDFFKRKYRGQHWLLRAAKCRRIAAGLEPVFNNFLVADLNTGEAVTGPLYAGGK